MLPCLPCFFQPSDVNGPFVIHRAESGDGASAAACALFLATLVNKDFKGRREAQASPIVIVSRGISNIEYRNIPARFIVDVLNARAGDLRRSLEPLFPFPPQNHNHEHKHIHPTTPHGGMYTRNIRCGERTRTVQYSAWDRIQ